jgi:hypothetical protein
MQAWRFGRLVWIIIFAPPKVCLVQLGYPGHAELHLQHAWLSSTIQVMLGSSLVKYTRRVFGTTMQAQRVVLE